MSDNNAPDEAERMLDLWDKASANLAQSERSGNLAAIDHNAAYQLRIRTEIADLIKLGAVILILLAIGALIHWGCYGLG